MSGVVVEDGTGLATANAFNAVVDVSAYAIDRGLDFATTANDSDGITACILAGDYLANELRFRYTGTRQTATQRLPWPRTGASERGGLPIPSGTIPWRLIDAHAELAILAFSGVSLQDDLENGGLLISSDKIDVLQTDWVVPVGFQALTRLPGETIRVSVMGYLAPVLRLPGQYRQQGTIYQPVDQIPYLPSEFDNPPVAR